MQHIKSIKLNLIISTLINGGWAGVEHVGLDFLGIKLQKHKLISDDSASDGDDNASSYKEKLLSRQSDAIILNLLREPLRFAKPSIVGNCAKNLKWFFRLVMNGRCDEKHCGRSGYQED